MALIEDASEAEEYLDKNPNSQFARRTYIRSVFANIEGTIWILKDVCLNVKPLKGIRKMSVAEFALLKEESYELKNNGDLKISSKFLKLPDNIKFTFKIMNKLFQSNIDLGIGNREWNDFMVSIVIRNRITHPKKKESIVISDTEIETCKSACGWFVNLTYESLKVFIDSSVPIDKK